MTDYTHKNLKDDVEDSAEKFGLAPNLEARFGRSVLDMQGGGMSYQRMAPNFRGPFGHRHTTQEEVYVIIAGSGRIKLEDEIRELRQWDVVRVKPTVARGFESGPDGLELIAIGFGEGGEAEILQEFWPAD
jgi:mannose-6-phosphate isomerase-like protein (cupin superfamily)